MSIGLDFNYIRSANHTFDVFSINSQSMFQYYSVDIINDISYNQNTKQVIDSNFIMKNNLYEITYNISLNNQSLEVYFNYYIE